MLRVCFALPGLHRVARGAETTFEALAETLAAREGCHVTLIGSGPPDPTRSYTFLHAGCIPRERFRRMPGLPLVRSEYAYEELTFLPGLARVYRPERYDVTVTCSYPYTNWFLRARGRRRGRPPHVFVTENGDWPVRRLHREYRLFGCEGLVCTNVEYYRRHRERWRAVLIPNGIDVERFAPGPSDLAAELPPGRPRILMVSALIPSKRVVEGIEAVAGLEEASLVVVGDGPLAGEVDRLGGERLGPRYRRLTLPSSAMPQIYRAADVLLHMSRDEPFGNIYLEALASGLPVVADDNENTRWILETGGLPVDTARPEAVRSGLRAAVARQGELGPAARERARTHFSWPKVARAYREFLVRVAAGDG